MKRLFLIVALLLSLSIFAQVPVDVFGTNPTTVNAATADTLTSSRIEFKNFKNDRAWNLLGLAVQINDVTGDDTDSIAYQIVYDLEDLGTVVGDYVTWTIAADTAGTETTIWIDPDNDDAKKWIAVTDPTAATIQGFPLNAVFIRRILSGDEISVQEVFNAFPH